MKKILIIAADGLTKSGVPNVFINIIRNLSNFGYVFDVLYFDEKDAFYKSEIEKYGGRAIYSNIDSSKTSKFNKLKVKFGYKKEIKNIIKKYGPYYCVHSFKGFESGYILKAAKNMGVQHRISHMTFFYRKPSNILIRLIEFNERRLMEKYSSYIVSDSQRTSDNNMPKSKKKIVIRNFVDDGYFKFSEYQKNNNGINLVQIGSYSSNKNQLFSLELFIKILSKYPESRLNFVGFRNPDELEYFDSLKEEVEKRDLSNNVSFFEHSANTNALFAQCNYLLFPSHNESFGIVAVEAQLSGLTCFCSNSISEEGNCGGCVYLPLDDENAWVDNICSTFEKDGGAHHHYDCSKFLKENIIQQYIDIYNESLKLNVGTSKYGVWSRLKKAVKSIGSFFTNLKNPKVCFLSFSLALFGSICLLVSGATNSGTNVYKSAAYVAELIQNNNQSDHVAVVVEQKVNGVVPDTATELRGLYGAFGNRESNYAGTINASKNKDITFADFDIDKRLSFVYVQTGVQVSKAKDDNGTIHYRMEFYPLELMFDFYPNKPTEFYSFLYLSTSQARKIIDQKYPGLFNSETSTELLLKNTDFINKCKEIIGTGVNVKFDDEIKSFQITNIFYEKDYFYNIVSQTIGEFLVGYNQYPEGYQKQATYFLNKYEYQNKFYLDYIKERYNKNNCDYDVTSLGLNSKIDKNAVLNCLNETSNTISVVLLTISIISIITGLFFMFKYNLFNLSFSFYFLTAILLPYITGFIFWKISRNIIYFSPYFTTWMLGILIALSFFVICLYLIKKWKKRENKNV